MADAVAVSRRTECLFEKSSTRCAVSFFSPCLRRPRPGRCIDAVVPRTFTFSGTVQMPGVTLPAGTYIFEVVNPEQRRRHRPRDGAAIGRRCISCSSRAPCTAPSGQSRGDHLTRGNLRRQPSASESVVSARRDPRPRVHLLARRLPSSRHAGRHKSCTAGKPLLPFTVHRLPFTVYRRTFAVCIDRCVDRMQEAGNDSLYVRNVSGQRVSVYVGEEFQITREDDVDTPIPQPNQARSARSVRGNVRLYSSPRQYSPELKPLHAAFETSARTTQISERSRFLRT